MKRKLEKIIGLLCSVALALGLCTGCADTTQVDTEVAYPSTHGALKVVGTQLCDSQGNAVMLRGLSTHGIAWYPEYVNEEAFKEFREDWGCNVIRLAMYTAENMGYCENGDQEGLKELIRKGVKYATDHDMYVIVDWHVLNDSNPQKYKEEAKAFFAEMSEEFKEHENVIYEICNEPCNDTSWADIKSYAEEVIPVIRENDADAVIIVGTPNWSQNVGGGAAKDPIDEENIMYALHFYAGTHTDWLRNNMKSAIKNGLPIFVSEYGVCDAENTGGLAEEEAKKWIQLLNQYGVSHVAWNISNKDEASAILKDSCLKVNGWAKEDLSETGAWLYDMFQEWQVNKEAE